MKPKPPTREQLVDELARRHRLSKARSRQLLNQVLLEVHTFAWPLFHSDYTAGELFDQLHRWMGIKR